MEFSIFAPNCFHQAKKIVNIRNCLVKSFYEASISADSLFSKLKSACCNLPEKGVQLDVFQ